MLILHRRRHEAIRIGEHIRVVVLESEAGGTRLGIDAPRHMTILREEIFDQVEAENALASRAAIEVFEARSSTPSSTRD